MLLIAALGLPRHCADPDPVDEFSHRWAACRCTECDPGDPDIMILGPPGRSLCPYSHPGSLFRVLIGLSTLTVFALELFLSGTLNAAQTMAFTTLVMKPAVVCVSMPLEQHRVWEPGCLGQPLASGSRGGINLDAAGFFTYLASADF